LLPYRLLYAEMLVGFNAVQYLHCPAWPTQFNAANVCLFRKPEVYPLVAGRHKSCAGRDMVIERASQRGCDLYAGSDPITIALMADGFDPEPVISIVCSVDKDSRMVVE
jgi:hypothetical protein